MRRRTKAALLAGLVVLMVLGTAAVASAAPALALTATKTTVTYPEWTRLKVAATDGAASLPTTVTVQYRPIGTVDWRTLRTIPASKTAEGIVTVNVAPRVLRVNTAFRAVATGLESGTVNVSVKARLSKATARSKVKAGKRVTVKGFIWPRHARGSRVVVVKFWKWEGGEWVYKGHVHPKIVGHTGEGSKWQFTRRTKSGDKGKWRMRVYHRDAQHVASMSRYSYIRVK